MLALHVRQLPQEAVLACMSSGAITGCCKVLLLPAAGAAALLLLLLPSAGWLLLLVAVIVVGRHKTLPTPSDTVVCRCCWPEPMSPLLLCSRMLQPALHLKAAEKLALCYNPEAAAPTLAKHTATTLALCCKCLLTHRVRATQP